MTTSGVVAALVIAVRPHPRGDRIWLADITDGTTPRTVVFGGVPVVTPGSIVAYAPPGARLPGGKIRARAYRGVRSDGMLCSQAELGWGAESDRVAVLSPLTAPGQLDRADFRALLAAPASLG
jgi:phenylalanyl-tRNA synthetase beta chain